MRISKSIHTRKKSLDNRKYINPNKRRIDNAICRGRFMSKEIGVGVIISPVTKKKKMKHFSIILSFLEYIQRAPGLNKEILIRDRAVSYHRKNTRHKNFRKIDTSHSIILTHAEFIWKKTPVTGIALFE